MTVWMKVTADAAELPMYVADSAEELGRILGIKAGTIRSAVYLAKKHGTKCRYVCVKFPSEEITDDDFCSYEERNEKC